MTMPADECFVTAAKDYTMKPLFIGLLLSSLALPCLSACNTKPAPEKANPDSSVGELPLETAAKNSDRAKEAEAAVKAASDKVNADLDAAVKQANEGN